MIIKYYLFVLFKNVYLRAGKILIYQYLECFKTHKSLIILFNFLILFDIEYLRLPYTLVILVFINKHIITLNMKYLSKS